MALPTFLDGSGTKSDPYIIKKYDDLERLDLYKGNYEESMGLYFKLVNDIDMRKIKRNWHGIDLNDGFLYMGDRRIISPDITNTFLFNNAFIYSDKESYNELGVQTDAGKDGMIINVHGSNVKSIGHHLHLQHIYLDCNVEYLKGGTQTDRMLLPTLKSDSSYIRIQTTDRYEDKPLIRAGGYSNPEWNPLGSNGFIVDTCIDINGYVMNSPIITPVSSEDPTDILVLDRCLIKGMVNCDYINYDSGSSNINIVNGKIRDSIFYLLTVNNTAKRGYKAYATNAAGVNLSVLPGNRNGTGVYVGNEQYQQTNVVEYSTTELKRYASISTSGFPVMHKGE